MLVLVCERATTIFAVDAAIPDAVLGVRIDVERVAKIGYILVMDDTTPWSNLTSRLPPALGAQIGEYRHDARHETRRLALIRLLERGLEVEYERLAAEGRPDG